MGSLEQILLSGITLSISALSLNFNLKHIIRVKLSDIIQVFKQRLILYIFDLYFLTDTGKDSKLVHRQKRPKVDAIIFLSFFRRGRATSMTQSRVENTRVHFWTFSPVPVKEFQY